MTGSTGGELLPSGVVAPPDLDVVPAGPSIGPATSVLTVEISRRLTVGWVPVEAGVLAYITSIIRATRASNDVLLGASPRAGIALLLGSKVLAEWTAPGGLPTRRLDGPSSNRRVVLDVQLRKGDVIVVEGLPDGQETAALDYLELRRK